MYLRKYQFDRIFAYANTDFIEFGHTQILISDKYELIYFNNLQINEKRKFFFSYRSITHK